MVKAGFIVEGTSDLIVLKAEKFQKYLFHKLGITSSEEWIIGGRGKSNIKKNFKSFINRLDQEVDFVFIMIDQDDKEQQRKNRKYKPVDCPLITVNEIISYGGNKHNISDNLIFIVMTREFEAWLIADKSLGFTYDGNPEEIINPSDFIGKQLRTSSHIMIANLFKDKFSIERAAKNAKSANRFLLKLREIQNKP